MDLFFLFFSFEISFLFPEPTGVVFQKPLAFFVFLTIAMIICVGGWGHFEASMVEGIVALFECNSLHFASEMPTSVHSVPTFIHTTK